MKRTPKKTQQQLSEIYHFLLENEFNISLFSDSPEREFINSPLIEFERGNKRYRLFVETLKIQESDDCFDRWANSVQTERFIKRLNVACVAKALDH